MQWVNLEFSVYDKATGAVLAGPFPGKQFWSGFPGILCQSENGGDPVILYDRMADRWVATQLAYNSDTSSNSYCVAVSTSPDALGSYNRYEFNTGGNLPDYPKLGIWPDGYYVTSNTFGANGNFFTGARSCAMDRSRMLAGLSAQMICFQRGIGDFSLLPSDLDGSTPPPAGSPNYNLELGTSTSLNLFKFHADFVTPSNSTFTGPTTIPVAAYTDAGMVPQPSPGQALDSLGDRLMFRLAYRNFGDHEALVSAHSVNTGTGVVGVRWYEIRNPGGAPTLFQQRTSAFPSAHMWLPSIAMDRQGNMAMIFNATNPSAGLSPSLAVAARLASDPPGQFTALSGLAIGSGVQVNVSRGRWGDYAAIVLDPVDDCTFWMTGEYIKTTGTLTWSTKIVSAKIPSCQ